MRTEIEDGFGCAGLVPTKAEASAEDAFRRERKAYEQLEQRCKRLQTALEEIQARAIFMLCRDPMNHQAEYIKQQARHALEE